MKRRTKADWLELIEQQATSGLSIAAFCKQHALGQTYFYKRKSELKGATNNSAKTSFIKIKPPVVTSTENDSIKVQHMHSQLSLPETVSPLWLAEFIKALA